MDVLALGVLDVAATVALVAGFGPLLGTLASKAAGLRADYGYWLRAGTLGWLAGQAQLAAAGGAALALSAAFAAPSGDPGIVITVSLLAVVPSVAVGVFVGAIVALRRERAIALPTSEEIVLRERYATGQIDMLEFERRVERLLTRQPWR